jgi:hypothetical protein
MGSLGVIHRVDRCQVNAASIGGSRLRRDPRECFSFIVSCASFLRGPIVTPSKGCERR